MGTTQRMLMATLALAVGLCITRPASGAFPPGTRNGFELLRAILQNPNPVKASGFFKLLPDEITALTEALISRMDMNLKAAANSKRSPSWSSTMQPRAVNDAVYGIVSSIITIPASVSPDEAVRNASLAAADRLSRWGVDAAMRTDVYSALKAFNATQEAGGLSGERARYLKFALRDARRSGLELPKEKRDELGSLLKRVSKTGLDFQACLDADTTTLSFTPSELEGTAPDFIASHKKDPDNPGKLVVTVKYPDYLPIMQDCKVEATRKSLEFAFNNVCSRENTQRLDELVTLRARVADLLGYSSWAAYVQEVLMAKSPRRVGRFLSDLAMKLQPLRDDQLSVLLSLKKGDKAAAGGPPSDGHIYSWEYHYYLNEVEQRNFKVDKQALKEYFPLEHVMSQMLDIYQEILGLQFVKDAALSKAAWAKNIDAYQVQDAVTRELLGVFYLDLHPRDGKYGHAAMFGLQAPTLLPNGTKSRPQNLIGAGALVCNFPASTEDQPSLLPHDDVITLFHEFGHLTHQILGRATLMEFAGISMDTDFVEAPSQMLENWCWEPAVLKRISRHYRSGQPLPDEMIDKLVKSRNANGGITNSRQVGLGLFDQSIHTSTRANTWDVYRQTMEEVSGITQQDGTNPAARFGHMVGYDAQYYSYMWSQVFSADMFRSRFLREGIFSAKAGSDYRRLVLKPGGTEDPDILLKRFLGRSPTQTAFLESLGLSPGGPSWQKAPASPTKHAAGGA